MRQGEVEALRLRLQLDDFIAGLTVHQAKGREWPHVGVALSPRDEQVLAGNLRELEVEHCVLQVALTPAKESCVALGEPGEFEFPEGG